MKEPTNDLFLRACARRDVERTPVWFMRQAGRYLPEYRAIREKVDFLTLCKTPDLAAEVTVQPVDLLGVDAAIIFSDILVLPEAMGMRLTVEEGGPRFPSPVRSRADIERLCQADPTSSLAFVFDAIRETRRRLSGRVPLIGFSGSPWTLAAYMIEGVGPREFRRAKGMIYSSPRDAHRLLEILTRAVTAYLSSQIDAGAQAIQIFDTWGGVLDEDAFEEFSLQYIRTIVTSLKARGVPLIVFCKGCGHALGAIAEAGADVVGLDWMTDIGRARRLIGRSVALQGNLDPVMLLSTPARIEQGVRSILAKYGNGSGHVFNLGHGVLPDTPLENVQTFVRAVKEYSRPYHQQAGAMV